jgi:hypothetical protein
MKSLLHQGEDALICAMKFQKSQPAETGHECLSTASKGPLKNITSRMKSARPRNARKIWLHFEHLRTAMARTGRYEEKNHHKGGVGANRPHVQRRIFRMRVVMAAANCSSAIASRRTKYDSDFRALTILGAQH